MSSLAVDHFGLDGGLKARRTQVVHAGMVLSFGACLLAGILQWFYFSGIIGSDDLTYFSIAEQARAGHVAFPPDDHTPARIVLWKPMQLIISVLPGSAWALALPSTAAVWVVLLTASWMANRFDGGGGWLAMALLAIVPIYVVIASTLLPDAVGSALGWLGVAIAARPLMERQCGGALWRCVLAGLIVAAGYNAKEPVLLFVPGMMLYVLTMHRRDRWAWARGIALACGAAVWLGLEMLWLWHVSGDPLFHPHSMSLSQRTFVAPVVGRTIPGLLRHWTEYARWLATPTSDFGPAGLVLLAGAILAVWVRTTWTVFVLCTILPAALYLSVGSTDVSRYTPLIHQSRYFVPILPGLALLAAAVLVRIWRRYSRWRPAVCVMGVILLGAGVLSPNRLASNWYFSKTFMAGEPVLRHWAQAHGKGERLCASDLTRARFARLTNWFRFPQIETIESAPRCQDEWIARYGGAYVLVSRFDRVPPPVHHAQRSLYGESMRGLAGFERVTTSSPTANRLGALSASLLGGLPPLDREHAVELWRVPTTAPASPQSPVPF